MKVICIDAKSKNPNGWCELEEGKVYDVIPSIGHCNIETYTLLGQFLFTQCSCGKGENSFAQYRRDRFIPLSSQDETESEVYKQLQVQTA